ncbi:MAG: phosphotransferase [Chloroflexota bacterium]
MTKPIWSRIQVENPDIEMDNITLLGEGWGAWAYRISESMVIKLSKRADGWGELAKQFAVLEFVHPRLPLAVPIPLAQHPKSAGWPFGYTIYSLIPGEPIDMDTLSKTQRSAAAETLAHFLRMLHDLKPDDTLRSILPNEDSKIELDHIYEQAQVQVLPDLAPADSARLRTTMQTYLDESSNFTFRPTLIHADLHNDHLLTQNGMVTGILDFDGASLGDPDDDFSDFYLEFGADFAAECARSYGHPEPQALVEKLRHRSVFVYLHDILYAPEYGLVDDVEWAWAGLRGWLEQAK